MSTAVVKTPPETWVHTLGRLVLGMVETVGDLSLFSFQMLRWMLARMPQRSVLLPTFYQIGVLSLPVVVVTGAFIGMVLAVQTYDQLVLMKLETRLGAVINISLVKELGPVLAATMLAGRVGSAMAAELGTMRVTEQIDALRALGADPIHYLVVPRFLACFLLIPLLTAVADGVGIVGGWLFSTQYLGVNSFHYWAHSNEYIGSYEVLSGIFKSFSFGGAIALVACHRGFNCGAGAEGVGRAATESFVFSFVAILVLDFFLGIILNALYFVFWTQPATLVMHSVPLPLCWT